MIYNLATNNNYSYWSQGRVVFKGTGVSDPVKVWSNAHGSQAEPIATLSPDSGGAITIDVTDYVRTYNETIGGQVTLYFGVGATTYTHQMTNAGLISPSSVLIPENEIGGQIGLKVFAPSTILGPIAAGAPIIFEISNDNLYEFQTGRIKELPSETVSGFARANTLALSTTEIEFSHLGTDLLGKVALKELDDCKLYAAVEWVSFTGVKRRHTMEVRKRKTSNADTFSLLGTDNEYVSIKGRVDGFDLYLDGLDEYDVWYYADIINSSDVRVSFDGTNWARVEVTTKNYTLPDGEVKNGEIEISLNWKKYDAVAL